MTRQFVDSANSNVQALSTKDLLDLVLTKARRHPGMGSVSVAWHPYECRWFAKADWSNNKVVELWSKGYDDPDEALQELSTLLDNPALRTDPESTENVEES